MKKVFFLFLSTVLIFTCCLSAQVTKNIFSVDDIYADHSVAEIILPEDKTGINSKEVFILSNPSDYFRSIAAGDWSATTTWESSPDNGVTPWAAATLVPNSLANTITIRNTHTVTVSSNQDMDQVVIEGGGILLHSANTLTVNDGTGDDIIVQGGGVFTLASAANAPVFSVSTATANINSGGTLRVATTGLTFAGVGVNANNYSYQHLCVLEYTPGSPFATDGVTYFPNANAVTIPIFRTTNNIGITGANTNTVFNGLFEANGNISFQNNGTKTFRNGITGTGNITSAAGSGKFIINGTTASLGGTGLLTLPTSGLDIGPTATVTMVSDKSVTGNIAFLANSFIMLGIYNLTMTGTFSGFSATSHVVTNGSGKVVINNIGVFPGATFPIGANTTTINPLLIFNGQGLNYGARVEIGLNPPIGVPVQAVNRTWVVRPSATPAGTVNVNFFYAMGHGNASFAYFPATVELGLYTAVWNVINTGLVQNGSYQVTGTVDIFAGNTDAPLVIANIGAILAINNSIQLSAQKQNDKTILNWVVDNAADISQFIPERSADGRVYTSLAKLTAADFSFTDVQPLPGLNYYRIKTKDKNGKITYSNIAIILNAKKGFQFISISPNPVVNSNFKLNVTAAQKTKMEIVITDMQGRMMQKQTFSLIAGFNTLPMNVTNFSAGTYQVYGITADGRSRVLRFVIPN